MTGRHGYRKAYRSGVRETLRAGRRYRAVPITDEPGPDLRSLAALARAENACRRCPLFREATQVVPGEGRPRARMLLVGEQPGDREDLEGRPFVGPAGRILDEALREAEIPREQTFVTNAVKHFKYERRGKRRLHKKPNAYEIDRCRWWLDLERALLKPAVVVALGATAARGVTGRSIVVGRARGSAMSLPDGSRLVVTVHPSYLLRIRNSGDWRSEYRRFVADLRFAARCVPVEPGHVSAA